MALGRQDPHRQELELSEPTKSKRVIDRLRDKFPGMNWRWSSMAHRWETDIANAPNWAVEPRIGLEDNTVRYFRTDTGEEVIL